MTTTDILKAFSTIHNGTFFHIEFFSNLDNSLSASAKKNGYHVEKYISTAVRKGLKYENLKSVREGRQSGTLPPCNNGLPWGNWKVDNIIIENKGTDYVRLYKSKKNNINVVYKVNGIECTLNDLKQMGIMIPSYFNRHNDSECLNVKADGILVIG